MNTGQLFHQYKVAFLHMVAPLAASWLALTDSLKQFESLLTPSHFVALMACMGLGSVLIHAYKLTPTTGGPST